MMGMDTIPHAEIWKAFFQDEPAESYSFLIHCKDEQKCKDFVESSGLGPFAQVVPPVFNAWCDDLVSPMLQLLKFALAKAPTAGYPVDKFAFVSTEHLPVKPLKYISKELAKRPDESDMCVHDTCWWMPLNEDPSTLAVAAFQWSVFSKRDAVRLRERMPDPSPTKQLVVARAEGHAYEDFSDTHCIDEVSIFWTLYGLAHLPGHRNGTVKLSFPDFGTLEYPKERRQGRCMYFGVDGLPHEVFQHAKNNDVLSQTVLELQRTPDADIISPETHCQTGCETIWIIDSLGPNGQRFLRDSRFLFGRKFSPTASLPGYASVVFA